MYGVSFLSDLSIPYIIGRSGMETSPLLPVVHQKLILCASHFDLLLTEALSSHTPEQRAGMGPLSTPDLSGDPFSCILCVVYQHYLHYITFSIIARSMDGLMHMELIFIYFRMMVKNYLYGFILFIPAYKYILLKFLSYKWVNK